MGPPFSRTHEQTDSIVAPDDHRVNDVDAPPLRRMFRSGQFCPACLSRLANFALLCGTLGDRVATFRTSFKRAAEIVTTVDTKTARQSTRAATRARGAHHQEAEQNHPKEERGEREL